MCCELMKYLLKGATIFSLPFFNEHVSSYQPPDELPAVFWADGPDDKPSVNFL